MISTTRCRSFLLFVFLLTAPLQALAQVHITEVMYDAPGADQGHEWVELTNAGSSTVSVAGWKFFAGGVNHGIAAAQGSTTLAAGESAIIANDPSQFVVDFPSYAGAVFKSSFSLPNTSATLALKDAKLNIVDSLAYNSKLGGSGDGNTLHLTAAGLIAGAPDPGIYTATPPAPIAKPAPAVSAPAPASKTVSKIKSSSHNSAAPQPSAGSDTALAELPLQETPWMQYGLGFAALLVCTVAGALYLRLERTQLPATLSAADEFDIEE